MHNDDYYENDNGDKDDMNILPMLNNEKMNISSFFSAVSLILREEYLKSKMEK